MTGKLYELFNPKRTKHSKHFYNLEICSPQYENFFPSIIMKSDFLGIQN